MVTHYYNTKPIYVCVYRICILNSTTTWRDTSKWTPFIHDGRVYMLHPEWTNTSPTYPSIRPPTHQSMQYSFLPLPRSYWRGGWTECQIRQARGTMCHPSTCFIHKVEDPTPCLVSFFIPQGSFGMDEQIIHPSIRPPSHQSMHYSFYYFQDPRSQSTDMEDEQNVKSARPSTCFIH